MGKENGSEKITHSESSKDYNDSVHLDESKTNIVRGDFVNQVIINAPIIKEFGDNKIVNALSKYYSSPFELSDNQDLGDAKNQLKDHLRSLISIGTEKFEKSKHAWRATTAKKGWVKVGVGRRLARRPVIKVLNHYKSAIKDVNYLAFGQNFEGFMHDYEFVGYLNSNQIFIVRRCSKRDSNFYCLSSQEFAKLYSGVFTILFRANKLDINWNRRFLPIS